MRILAQQRSRQWDAAKAPAQVFLVEALDLFQVVLQVAFDRGRERRDPVLGALAIAHDDLVSLEVDVLHAQRERFKQPQARAV